MRGDPALLTREQLHKEEIELNERCDYMYGLISDKQPPSVNASNQRYLEHLEEQLAYVRFCLSGRIQS